MSESEAVPGREAGGSACAMRHAGGSIPGLSRAAFVISDSSQARIPVLIAVPHAGRAYPPALVARMRHGDAVMRRLEDRHADAIARAAAAQCGAMLLIADAPRAMIDLNRDPADLDHAMFVGEGPARGANAHHPAHRSARGLGLFPRRLGGIGELWKTAMTAQDAERRIAAIHAPYHAALARALSDLREDWGAAVLIDLHSMPSLNRRPGEGPPPSHVVGDRFGASCARFLADDVRAMATTAGFVCAYNRPYAGGYVLARHGAPRREIHALQLEIDRACYLDAVGQCVATGVGRQAALVAEIATALARRIVDSPRLRHAAQ